MVANPGDVKDYGTIKVNVGLDKFTMGGTAATKDGKLTLNIETMKGDLSKMEYTLDSHSWVIKMADAAAHGTIVK